MPHQARLGRSRYFGQLICTLTRGALTFMHICLTARLSSGCVVQEPRTLWEVLDMWSTQARPGEGFSASSYLPDFALLAHLMVEELVLISPTFLGGGWHHLPGLGE